MPPWHVLLPETLKRQQRRQRVLQALHSDAPILHLTHAQCLDGAACSLLHWLKYGRDQVADVALHPYQVAETVTFLTDSARDAKTLHISDLSVGTEDDANAAAKLRTLGDEGWTISWRDHHAGQWTEVTRGLVEAGVDTLVLDTEERYCAADLVQQDLLPDDDFAREVAETVRDRDLWIRDDPRSDELALAMNQLGPQNLAEVLFESRDLDDPRIGAAAQAWREQLAEEREEAKDDTKIVESDGRRIGVLYGDYTTSDTAHAIREAHDTDIEVLLKPTGAVSLRCRDGLDVSEVARQFGGGGHDQSAGCSLGLTGPEYLWYWLTSGGGLKPKRLIEALGEI